MGRPTPLHEVRAGLERGKNNALALLGQAINDLKEKIEDSEWEPASVTPLKVPLAESKKVFLVHGHDNGVKETVARFLDGIGFEPIILHEHPNCGQTVIEKFELHSDVGFAVVLLTPDDNIESGKKRARQNVILELGYFIGKLGRAKVCALKKGEIELPSDILGIAWTEVDDAGAWRMSLGKEIEAAGFELDWNQVMRGRV
jgi:predicted nucleotide-binding protein